MGFQIFTVILGGEDNSSMKPCDQIFLLDFKICDNIILFPASFINKANEVKKEYVKI